jgi:single-stranded-DNA-specific exonuclease
MKERHIRLELAQESALATSSAAMRAVGWDLAGRVAALKLAQGSLIDVAYRIRENDHPQYGGLEVEIAGIRLCEEDSKRTEAHD